MISLYKLFWVNVQFLFPKFLNLLPCTNSKHAFWSSLASILFKNAVRHPLCTDTPTQNTSYVPIHRPRIHHMYRYSDPEYIICTDICRSLEGVIFIVQLNLTCPCSTIYETREQKNGFSQLCSSWYNSIIFSTFVISSWLQSNQHLPISSWMQSNQH